MEKNDKSWEQPQTQAQTGEVDNTKEEAQKSEGSHGKFKDADALLSAYNSLQAEFTRKCQRLAELEKQKEEQALDSTPLYERENWSEIVADFLSKNDEAKPFSKEICAEIMNNPKGYLDERSLDLAYAKVMKNHIVDEAKMQDKNFVEDYVLSSDEIKDKVLKIYLEELSHSAPPKVLSSGVGETFSKKVVRPATLEEAKQFVQNLMEN